VYVTCLDGTVACFDQATGKVQWKESRQATSSPQVYRGQCYYSQRRQMEVASDKDVREIQQMEEMVCQAAAVGSPAAAIPETAAKADYLDLHKRRLRSPHYAEYELQDAAVGFAAYKGDAKMHQAHANLGHGHVSGLWAYQGSRPFAYRECLYSALGETLHCVDAASQSVQWKERLYHSEGEVLDTMMTPPALVNGKVFLGSIRGDICCLSAETGKELWRVSIDEPVQFQPAIAQGRLYAATSRGNLYCIETGDPADDGWLMWGATSAHNGLPEA
jgi:outer membrane protein assembly factor BamB